MTKKTYLTPNILVVELPQPKILAGSEIQEGNTDGQGSGQFDASAKGTSLFFDDEDNDAPAW